MSHRFRPNGLLGLAALFTALAVAQPASAQEDAATRARAQALFDEAQELLKVRDFARACPKLEEVNNLLPGKIGALMELAACYEGWGKTTSAWARYRTAADLATKTRDPRKAEADAKVGALGPQVPRLVVVVPDSMRAVSGIAIEADGVPLGPASWGTSIPVDPGAHEVSASAPNKRKWSTKIEANRPGETITVTIPSLAEEAGGNGGQIGGGGFPGGVGGTAGAKQAGWLAQHTAGVVLAGAGLVSVGVMTGFGIDAAQKHAASHPYCTADRKYCEQPGLDLERRAHSSANVSNGFLVAGATLAAAGVLVFVLAPSPFQRSGASGGGVPPVTVSFSGGPQSAGASIQGGF